MINAFILGMQIAIIVVLGISLRNNRKSIRSVEESIKLIKQYRSEIEWLTARVDALEQRGGVNGKAGVVWGLDPGERKRP